MANVRDPRMNPKVVAATVNFIQSPPEVVLQRTHESLVHSSPVVEAVPPIVAAALGEPTDTQFAPRIVTLVLPVERRFSRLCCVNASMSKETASVNEPNAEPNPMLRAAWTDLLVVPATVRQRTLDSEIHRELEARVPPTRPTKEESVSASEQPDKVRLIAPVAATLVRIRELGRELTSSKVIDIEREAMKSCCDRYPPVAIKLRVLDEPGAILARSAVAEVQLELLAPVPAIRRREEI